MKVKELMERLGIDPETDVDDQVIVYVRGFSELIEKFPAALAFDVDSVLIRLKGTNDMEVEIMFF